MTTTDATTDTVPTALFETTDATETVRATIARIFYNERGRVIASAMVDPSARRRDGKRFPGTISVLGPMVDPIIGQQYEFTGPLTYDAKYQRHQVKFETYRTILPTDTEAIRDYLVNVASWCGPSVARHLVDLFEDKTLEVIREHPEQVYGRVKGLTNEKVDEMRDSLLKNAEHEAATIEVNNLIGGVMGPRTVEKAVKKWGTDAAAMIRANPYVLTALPGVGFHTADAVHKRLGLPDDDPNRREAAVLHALAEAASGAGHTAVDRDAINMETQRLISAVDPDAIGRLAQRRQIEVLTGFASDTLSLADLADAEAYIAAKLTDMLSLDPQDRLCPRINTEGLADDQAAAVRAFERSNVFILTGGPGCGKTYTLARIVKTLTAAGLRVALCAPTGKAAKQMSVALAGAAAGATAPVTIHSLLEPTVDDEGEFHFARNETAPLDADVVIVDEFSMVDVRLCRSLLRAVPSTSRLLIVGDDGQLPSVGPGSVLRDLLRAGLPSACLTTIKRNAGLIVQACHAIRRGEPPAAPPPRLDTAAGVNWRHIDCGDPTQIVNLVRTLVAEKLPALGLDMLWDVQVVCPTNEKGDLSCDVFNTVLRDLLNPAGRIIRDRLPFRLGDKVVRLRNATVPGRMLQEGESDDVSCPQTQEIRIVNGDIGTVTAHENKEAVVRFRFPDRLARVKLDDHHLKLAYALTCHKMQGSEVPVVILPLHQSLTRIPLLTREWLYTAMSRAKRILITVGDLAAIPPAIARVGNNARQTRLQRLIEERRPRT